MQANPHTRAPGFHLLAARQGEVLPACSGRKILASTRCRACRVRRAIATPKVRLFLVFHAELSASGLGRGTLLR